jgi:hypothetical protein
MLPAKLRGSVPVMFGSLSVTSKSEKPIEYMCHSLQTRGKLTVLPFGTEVALGLTRPRVRKRVGYIACSLGESIQGESENNCR